GSYFVEWLTSEVQRQAQEILDHIYNDLGGVLKATEQGYFRRAIADSSARFGAEFDRGERIMVGVNKYQEHDFERIPILKIDEHVEREQVSRLKDMKQRRDRQRHAAALERLRQSAAAGENVMPALIDAAEALATVGEMMETLKGVYGQYDGGPEL
ncbi:MAG TPA: methylmalonyl-CoA mutase family protein, partial [Phycisphaerae bacterium]|nr:methylmalonyl-CoA mutase family protein [Phycisphaerae bacterium]